MSPSDKTSRTGQAVVHSWPEPDIALVTMDRPPVNAVNAQFLDDMMLVFDTLSDRDDVRVAILTGAGRTFCAGADIKERAGRERLRLGWNGCQAKDGGKPESPE